MSFLSLQKVAKLFQLLKKNPRNDGSTFCTRVTRILLTTIPIYFFWFYIARLKVTRMLKPTRIKSLPLLFIVIKRRNKNVDESITTAMFATRTRVQNAIQKYLKVGTGKKLARLPQSFQCLPRMDRVRSQYIIHHKQPAIV